ncbi:MAG: hypothetical protein A3B11_00105 [Candidatus Taylorbacteria bacterium RIFCSPLOWO2_01_FULL_44_26]|uniref:Large ribosomal subunit protein uL15 n=2 Tax=Candidatus Tayloriibacteriota TaxID=1817919 RepID=A0A1G2N4Q7_9BACT|nr:MAG: hypothetical protein A3B11_00105 [Candidatus Taylorbacteria bacterium RIFCSPLOWO2_01_FULL_44_26]
MPRMTVARGGRRGKTAGRGGKGQSARAGNKRRPEWRDIIKRLPKLRGRGKNINMPINLKPATVNIFSLQKSFLVNDNVSPAILVQKGLVTTRSGRVPDIKILGDGEIDKALNVSGCQVSAGARKKLEKAGGTVTAIPVMEIIRKSDPNNQKSIKLVSPKKTVEKSKTK